MNLRSHLLFVFLPFLSVGACQSRAASMETLSPVVHASKTHEATTETSMNSAAEALSEHPIVLTQPPLVYAYRPRGLYRRAALWAGVRVYVQ